MVFPLRYEPYEATESVPNVVVDGSPNAATTLSLTHWPGLPAPEGLADDSSAQIAFRYIDRGADLHGAAEVVTNNHFDQDGLVSAPGDITPELRTIDGAESTIDAADLVGAVRDHLRTAPAAWDPWAVRR